MSGKFKDFNTLGVFPSIRARRLRQASWMRDMVRETSLNPHDLIWPLFVIEGKNEAQPIKTMPGVNRLTIDLAVQAAKQAHSVGIPAIALFPNTPDDKRSELGEECANPDNLISRAIQEIKSAVPEVGIIGDVALDPYTTHGHDGILKDGIILNDETLDALKSQALNLAKALLEMQLVQVPNYQVIKKHIRWTLPIQLKHLRRWRWTSLKVRTWSW